jgi:nucleoid-associated protein YgaU
MPRLPHGTAITEPALRQAREDAALESTNALAFAAVPQPNLHRFDYLFPTLQTDPDALLPETDPKETVKRLRALADTMADDNEGPDSKIPAAYTYFGQFVDHDITLEAHTDPDVDTLAQILDDNMKPLSLAEARSVVKNQRTATFDLDSVYGSDAPRDPADDRKLMVGTVADAGDDVPPTKRPDGKGDKNDVPRLGRSDDERFDRAARIGDPRNDENTIISQMQVAFLKAHNQLVEEGFTFEQARSILRQHYQQIVIGDFLHERIADPAVVDDILENGNQWYDALSEPFFMPFELSVAAYRFGHTMVRAAYDFNVNFNLNAIPASLEFLFTFTALSGQLRNFDALPDNWIIEWENIIGKGLPAGGLARPIDTRISAKIGGQPKALFNLQTLTGQQQPGLAARLASRNLLRGYLMRMPTGQAVAGLLGLPLLTEQQLRDAVGSDSIGRDQGDALQDGEFLDRTPLWFYVLAEAAHTDGDHLGPVGSTIVAEVLIGLVRRSEDSILRVPGWRVALPSKNPGKFELADLLRFAGVLDGGAALKTHVVKSGETLSAIAKKHLGDKDRWPEIFAANRTIVRNPDQIFPEMRLIIPSGPAPDPQLRFIVVKRGDTLSALAKKHLGDADRWPEIFKLNASVLTNPDVIVVGQVLHLPGN